MPLVSSVTRLRFLAVAVVFLAAAVVIAFYRDTTSQAASLEASQFRKDQSKFVPGEILIRFKDSSELSKASSIAGAPTSIPLTAQGRQITLELERLDKTEVVKGLRLARVDPELTFQAIAALTSRSDVVYAEPNYKRYKEAVPNDPRYNEQWNLKNSNTIGSGVAGADIKAEQAWNVTKGSRGVVVAVIDEGIDVSHPDLQPNIWTNPAEIAGNGIDDDANGFTDDVNGFDFLHNDASVYDGPGSNPDGSVIDEHGTHVAGIIGAAGNNGIGVAGVNWEVSVMSLKFLGPDGGTSADVIKAFSYVRMMRELWISSNGTKGANIRITNNSYGDLSFSQAEVDAIQSLNDAGILFVAAAGNDSLNNSQIGHYPASYDLPNIISVASTTRDDKLSTFSNYGWSNVHLAAPGSSVLSTIPGNTYAAKSGTSMASPHVAGAAALVLSQHPGFTTNRLRASLIFAGAELSSLIGIVETGNRLDAASTLQNANETDSLAPSPITDLQVVSTVGRTVTLRWTSPGDDGSSGRAVLNEMRFTDQSSGKKYFIGTAKPAPTGTQQIATVNIPYQHTSGSVELRVIDNVGNLSTATVNVLIDEQAANPYEITESAAEPLSTGGTLLESNFDDFISHNFSLPFAFPYFEGDIESAFVSGTTSSFYYSTNGTLYFARSSPPSLDSFSTPVFLPGWRMIAGLWDDLDLRTASRSDAGVYMVNPDPNRVIFRWQGVPCNGSLATGQCQGGAPLNFEIELRSDGTIIKRYGSGNTELQPVVGISAGEFDPFVVASHTSASSNISLNNAPTLTYRLRNTPKKADVKIVSSSVSPHTVLVGTETTLKVTVSNLGPNPAIGTRIIGTLPLNVSVTSCSTPVGSCWATRGSVETKVYAELTTLQLNSPVTIEVQINLTSFNPFATIDTSWNVSSFTFDPVSTNNSTSINFNGLNPNPNPLIGALAVGAGGEHALAIMPGGNLLSWGQNSSSQLGADGILQRELPASVEGITNVLQVEGGFVHSIALAIDGRVWTWGGNGQGQLGDGTTTLRKTPQPLSGLTGVTAIAAGAGHNLSLLSNGTVWSWGLNLSGQLGDGTTTTRLTPVQVSGLTNVIAIAAGTDHSVAVKSDGTVWSWGENSSGKLGDGTEVRRLIPVQVVGLTGITSVSAGGAHSLALASDGRVWGWGTNDSGQLGDGTMIKKLTPVVISTLANVTKVAAGQNHSLALLSDGTVWSWGMNRNGALGTAQSESQNSSIPVKVLWVSSITSVAAGEETSYARRSDGKIFAWGNDSRGQLGNEGEFTRGFPYEVTAPVVPPQQPPPIGTLTTPTFSPDGGSFGSSQSVTIRSASADAVIVKAAFGWGHSLFLMSDGTVWAAGDNFNGTLGNGTTTNSTVLVQSRITDVVEVSAGAGHSVALKSDGTVWTWGGNGSGQLGIGASTSTVKTSPVRIDSLSSVVSVTASGSFSIALKSDGTVWTWGWNDRGQLGNGTETDSNVPTQVQGLSGVTYATAGAKHCLVLKSDGTAWTWGSNQTRELGDGTTVFRRLTPVQVVGLANVTAVNTNGQTCAATLNDGSVWTWGSNGDGQLGIGQGGLDQPTPVKVNALNNSTVSMGASHGLARFPDGSVKAWGWNGSGQIGNGGTVSQPSPIQVATDSLSINAGSSMSSMLKADGIWVWGENSAGQLGLGNTGDKLSPVKLNSLSTGVVIHYTTNGLDPTEVDPVITSGSSVSITQTTTLKARAFKTGWTPSAVKTATFTIAGAPAIQFSQSGFSVSEAGANFNISVVRVGDVSGAASVDYSTSDTAGANNCNAGGGQASSRCDYLTSLGRLTFAPGESAKSISIPVIDDTYVEGIENFTVSLSNAVGASLNQSTATLTINDNDSTSLTNPIDQANLFVRQQYIDFLNREPDAAGLAFWSNEIIACGLNTKCIEVKRINVSAAFFLSIEFQETGYLVYRVYKSGFGTLTTPTGAPVPVRFLDFLRDTQEVRKNVQVGIGDWQAKLESNKQAYLLTFVQRADFKSAFPSSLPADQFVTRLNTNAGGVLSAAEKSNLVTMLSANPTSESLRAQVLRAVAEDSTLREAETNRAFVLMQYFGYMRRNPFDPPDADFAGFNFWLDKLDQFHGNFVNAEMVKAFILSIEYRQRFAP